MEMAQFLPSIEYLGFLAPKFMSEVLLRIRKEIAADLRLHQDCEDNHMLCAAAKEIERLEQVINVLMQTIKRIQPEKGNC